MAKQETLVQLAWVQLRTAVALKKYATPVERLESGKTYGDLLLSSVGGFVALVFEGKHVRIPIENIAAYGIGCEE